jgi:hypothetical protein
MVAGPRLDSAYLPAAAAAHSLGLKTASFEISFLLHEHARLHRLAGIPETTDVLLYWGHLAVKRLRELGLPADECQVTGFHSLDHFSTLRRLREQVKPEISRYWSWLGVAEVESPVVLFGAHYGGRQAIADIDYLRDTAQAALEGLDNIGRGTLVVKTLTTDDPDHLSEIFGSLDRKRLRVLSPFHAFQNAHYFVGADLVLAVPTTLLAEAAAVGVPACTLNYGNMENWYPVSERHMDLLNRIAPLISSLQELRSIVERCGCNELAWAAPQQEAVQELFGCLQGGNLNEALRAMRGLGLDVENLRGL